MSTKPSQDDELVDILETYYVAEYNEPLDVHDMSKRTVALTDALRALKVHEERIAVRARISELERLKNDTAHQYGWGQTIAVDYKIIEDRIAALTQLQGEATEGE